MFAAVAVLATPPLLACQQPTQFTGSANFEGGPQGCSHKCKEAGLEMGAFVYVGDYSSGCVCQPTETAGGHTASPATGAAAAGVVSRARQRQAEAQRQQRYNQQQQQQRQQQQRYSPTGYGGY